MNIKKQPSGTALTADEMKTITALLVKLGYTVSLGKERNGGVTATIIKAEENV